MPAFDEPVVTVGIPTFNRAADLARALESVKSQTYAALEILVSDNASTDDTEFVCRNAARSDPRIAIERLDRNVGAVTNFERLLKRATGKYFMWLADDDWIDENYVEECLSLLTARPELILVGGRAVFHHEDGTTRTCSPLNVFQEKPSRRVVAYLWAVLDNSIYYGVAPLEELRRTLPLRRRIGDDWRVVADLAFLGQIETTPHATLHRSTGGASANLASLKATARAESRARSNPFLFSAVAWQMAAHVSREEPFKKARLPSRIALACRCFGVIWYRWSLRFSFERLMNALLRCGMKCASLTSPRVYVLLRRTFRLVFRRRRDAFYSYRDDSVGPPRT